MPNSDLCHNHYQLAVVAARHIPTLYLGSKRIALLLERWGFMFRLFTDIAWFRKILKQVFLKTTNLSSI